MNKFLLLATLILPSFAKAEAPKVWSQDQLLTIANWCANETMVSHVKEIYGVDLGLGGVFGNYLPASSPSVENFLKNPDAVYPIQGWGYYAGFNGCSIELSTDSFILQKRTSRCAMRNPALGDKVEFQGFETPRIFAQAYFYDLKKDSAGNVLSSKLGFVNPRIVESEREVNLVSKAGARTGITLDLQAQKKCLERLLR